MSEFHTSPYGNNNRLVEPTMEGIVEHLEYLGLPYLLSHVTLEAIGLDNTYTTYLPETIGSTDIRRHRQVTIYVNMNDGSRVVLGGSFCNLNVKSEYFDEGKLSGYTIREDGVLDFSIDKLKQLNRETEVKHKLTEFVS